MPIYKNFELLLKKFNVKAADVASATGIPASTFSDWKKGKSKPKSEKLQKLANYFGVPISYFLELGQEDTEKECE